MAEEVGAGGGGEDSLAARELESAKNSPALEEEHRQVTKGKVRTRFPPEPNGYLHIGHAKSMHMNFHLAFEKLGVPEDMRETVFRYDDTNPAAESQEYIDSLREDVEWLGWTPAQTTFTSEYFDQLYDLAVRLIRADKAYVCHQTGEQISKSRSIAKEKAVNPHFEGDPNSPWRDRPVEESLRVCLPNGAVGQRTRRSNTDRFAGLDIFIVIILFVGFPPLYSHDMSRAPIFQIFLRLAHVHISSCSYLKTCGSESSRRTKQRSE